MIQANNYQFRPTLRQAQAYDALSSETSGEVLYGGAKGGGKSYFGCHWCLSQCLKIIDRCKIDKTPKFPIPVGFMGRRVGKDFKDTTLETWKKVIPPEMYEIKGQPSEIIINGKVKMLTGGLDNSQVVNKFNSAEYMFFFVDQAEEVEKDLISVLRGSLRGKINDLYIPYQGLWTANPAQCFLKDDFIDSTEDHFTYIPALPTDNPHLPADYIETLTRAFKHRPELLAGYLKGDWDCFEGHNQVIKNAWILAAKQLRLSPPLTRRIITCDPAKFGDDETVIYVLENSKIVESMIYGQKTLFETAHNISNLSRKHAFNGIPLTAIIDGIGVGEGVIEKAEELKVPVITFKSSFKPTGDKTSINFDKYYNLRAEAWDYCGRKFQSQDIEWNNEDAKLKSQLCTPTYKFRNGKILIEPKADIKARTGKSPDRADAYIQGQWGLQWISPDVEGDYEGDSLYNENDIDLMVA
jgi:hypothetical protein